MSDQTYDIYKVTDPEAVKKLEKQNLDRLASLANQGIQIDVNALAILRTEALIEMLLPSEDQKTEFNYIIELKKKELLDKVFAEIRKQQIMEGVGQGVHRLPNLRG